MTSTVEPYTYQPLASPTSIRIVALEPSPDYKSPLTCFIIHDDREDIIQGRSGDTHWEAVSYVWGTNPKFTHSFLCDGGTTQIKITITMDQILRSLRKPTKIRYLWIDAVSLNQQDPLEKSVQIPLMADVYRGARKTHLCLDEIPRVLDLFNLLRFLKFDYERRESSSFAKRILKRGYNFQTVESLPSVAAYMQRTVPFWPALMKSKQDVIDFVQHPFWSRRWIMQEVFAGQNATVRCGEHTLPWTVVEGAFQALQLIKPDGYDFTEAPALLIVLERRQAAEKSEQHENLLYYLHRFSHCGCSDPRDRLFALQGLLFSKTPILNLDMDRVSYNQPWQEMYREVALSAYRIIQPYRADLFLPTVPAQERENDTIFENLCAFGSLYHTDPNQPSWVPNWSMAKTHVLHRRVNLTRLASPRPAAVLHLGLKKRLNIISIFCKERDKPFLTRFRSFIAQLCASDAAEDAKMIELLLRFFEYWDTPIWHPLFEYALEVDGQIFRKTAARILEEGQKTDAHWHPRMLKAIKSEAPGKWDTNNEMKLNASLQNTAICFSSELRGAVEEYTHVSFVPVDTTTADIIVSTNTPGIALRWELVLSPVRVRVADIDHLHMVDENEDPAEYLRTLAEQDPTVTAYRILGQAVMILRHEHKKDHHMEVDTLVI